MSAPSPPRSRGYRDASASRTTPRPPGRAHEHQYGRHWRMDLLLSPLIAHIEAAMPHAIIRRPNGQRHEVDFGDRPVRVEIHPSEETVEIFIEADFEPLTEEHRHFALLNIPRHLFSEATAAAARRAPNTRPAS